MEIQDNNERSAGEIASSIAKRVDLMIQDAVPLPDCPLKKDKAEWKRKEIKKKVGNILNPSSPMGITVSVTS